MFTEASSSVSSALALVSRSGVVGRWAARRPFLGLGFDSKVRASVCVREGFLMAFKAPGRDTLRWNVTVVWRVTLMVPDGAVRVGAARAWRPVVVVVVVVVDRLRARFSRDAACRESSLASCSARSRAVCDAINLFLALVEPALPAPSLRFFGEL